MSTARTSGFFSRLRSRRLVQWSLAYVAAAWVSLQAAELLFGIFGWPDTWLRQLTVILVFGLPAAVVIAWYHGEKGQQRASVIELVLLAVIGVAATFVTVSVDFSTGEPGAAASAINPFTGKGSRRVTANNYFESGPSWAPDSAALVYDSEQSGNRDLWILPRSGEASRLTDSDAEDVQPAWSPDGSSILFVSSREHSAELDRSVFYGYTFGGDIFSVPAFGGNARKLVDDGYNPCWSPDGMRFAFDSSRDGPRRIWLADKDGGDLVRLTTDDADLAAHIRPAWSPDGEWIVYERQIGSLASTATLVLSTVDGSRSFDLTDGTFRDMAPAWVDDDTIVFSSDRGGALNLWLVDIDFERGGLRRAPTRLTLGAGEDFDPSVAADGALAYATLRRLENLWQVDVDPATLTFGKEPRRLMEASWNDYAPALSLDNKRTVFTSDRAGTLDVWMLDADGSLSQLTSGDAQDLQPVWAPDDSKIAFFSNARGNDDIYILPLGGGPSVPVTPADSNDINPYWSSDGSRFGFTSDRSGRSEVWMMNVDGSGARQLTDIGTLGHTARWSPDDQWLLFTSIAEGDRDVWAVSADGNDLRRITNAPTQDAHGLWSADGKTVLYLSDHQKVFASEFGSDEHRLLFDLGETIDYVHLSRDGTQFQFTREKLESDIWIIE